MAMHKTLTLSGMVVLLFVLGCSGPQVRSEPVRKELPPPRTVVAAPEADEAGQKQLPELTESSGLSDYLAYAALNNPGLEAAFNRWKAALERVPQVKALPDPRFEYKYFIKEVETRVGPQQHSFGVSQVLPWFGKLDLRGEVAGEAAVEKHRHHKREHQSGQAP